MGVNEAEYIKNSDILITSHDRGHKIYYDGYNWRYIDTYEINNNKRPCVRCGKKPTLEGHDACKGHVDNAVSVCCGHGVAEPIMVME